MSYNPDTPIATDAVTRVSRPYEQDIRTSVPPEPIALHFPIVSGQAILGNPLGTFVAKFGQPIGTDQSGTTLNNPFIFNPLPNTNIYDIDVQNDSTDNDLPNTISNSRVIFIAINSPLSSWNSVQANAICSSFAPSDAIFVKLMQVWDDSGNLFGIDMVYFSKILAREFSAAMFQDKNSKPTKVGTFDIQYLYGNDTTHFSSCSFGLGNQQTTPPEPIT